MKALAELNTEKLINSDLGLKEMSDRWDKADEVIINKSIENKTYTNTLAANKKLKNDVISKASKSNK